MSDALTTWAEVRAHVEAAFGGVATPDGVIEARIAVSDGEQRVALAPRDGWIEISAVIGDARGVSPLALLRGNLRSLFGAVGVKEGVFSVRQLLPVEVSAVDLDEAIRAIAARCAAERGAL